eukprot:GFKZ01001050.1.p1 GENE.GFKZ01001050.1~~GFKZ01001050.1.p1  ORF type:complete len:102 (-),score=1.02 GFKZ01001050.1:363-668(-)
MRTLIVIQCSGGTCRSFSEDTMFPSSVLSLFWDKKVLPVTWTRTHYRVMQEFSPSFFRSVLDSGVAQNLTRLGCIQRFGLTERCKGLPYQECEWRHFGPAH